MNAPSFPRSVETARPPPIQVVAAALIFLVGPMATAPGSNDTFQSSAADPGVSRSALPRSSVRPSEPNAPAWAGPPGPDRPIKAHVVLANGVTALLHPIPDMKDVAIVAVYPVGFLHEPAGMTQAAHLLEHLVCNCATAGHRPGAAMDLLNAKGMANAETLPDWTHYDYIVPAADLELVIRIEAERLTSLDIDKQTLLREAPRCYREADFVEQNPRAGMTKHAFMAMSQGWRHGAARASVRGGLEALGVEKLRAFHRAYYRPSNLLLVIAGEFERDKALALLKQHLGGIQSPKTKPKPRMDWTRAPARHAMRWDSKVRAVCIAFPPPDDRLDRIVLSLWGNLLMQRLMNDADIRAATDSVSCTNQLWFVDTLPFFVYATAKPGTKIDELERVLHTRLDAVLAEKPGGLQTRQLGMFARRLADSAQGPGRSEIQQAVKMLEARGRDATSARRLALGQSALNLAAAFRLVGMDASKTAAQIESLSADELHRMIKKGLDPKRRFITTLQPE